MDMDDDDSRTVSAGRLDKWMKRNSVTNATLAAKVGVTAGAVHGWRKGSFRPAVIEREKIEAFTDGHVLAEGWKTSVERAEVRAVRPYVASTGTDGR